MRETNHWLRITAIWFIVTVIVEIYLIAINPPLGPRSSVEGFGEARTMTLFFWVGAPIFIFVAVFLLYAALVFRRQHGEADDEAEVEPANARGNAGVVFFWSLISVVTVFFLAGWGIFTLNDVAAAPHAVTKPFVVQVIAQQWHFTYRYPQYGGVESLNLAVPVNRPVTFQVTSLDVVHDFWIYDLDVKQDAVPGQTTYTYALANKVGKHWIVCDELCGIWHGYMRGPMWVMSDGDFARWIQAQKKYDAYVHGQLPTINGIYYPDTPSAFPPAPQNSAQ